MRFIGAACATLIATASIAAAPVPPADDSAQLSAEDQSLLRRAIERGALMYAYDQAAWHGSDDALAKLTPGRDQVDGWIVDGSVDAPHFIMIDRNEKDPHAVYEADFRNGALVSSRVLGPNDNRELSPSRKRMVAALRAGRQALIENHTSQCKPNPFNSIVLPNEDGSDLVYFLTPQTTFDAVPLGGHYLVEVSPVGHAGSVQAFTNVRCLEVPLKDEQGVRPTAVGMTDLLHSTPTEIQVFSSLTAHIPIYVGTEKNERFWMVEGTQIRLIDKLKK